MAHDVLIVDDEADIRALIEGILADEGYTTRCAAQADEALAALRARRPNLLILDIWLQNSHMDGMETLDVVVQDYPGLPVVMISGHGNIETAVAAIKNGAYDFIEKPFKADRLLLVAQRAIEAARLRRENRELKQRAGGTPEMIGNSGSMNIVRQAVKKVAPTSSRVLISGPPGAGKEVVARAIHDSSNRATGPFVIMNCAAMRPENMETELFGAESADPASGGRRTTIGTFEEAHGGTLLLDDVVNMPLETQSKIVRVLQEQTFQRVGGATRVEVDVRVMATTSRDPREMIEAGRFREDLYYRLNVVPIEVPPLRNRREDVPELAGYFMKRSTAGRGGRPLAEDAMVALQSYDWPGNVRQLSNVVDWLLIMAPGDADTPITANMLPPEVLNNGAPMAKPENGAEIMALPLREAREIFERQYLVAQISRFGGNISRTASFVGMERSALHRKLKSLGVQSGELPRDAEA